MSEIIEINRTILNDCCLYVKLLMIKILNYEKVFTVFRYSVF